MSWYDDILASEEKTRERLAWLQSLLSCKEHTAVSHGTTTRDGFGYSTCRCGAHKWDTDRFWSDMPRDDREKMEDEVEEMTTRLAEKFGGTYAI